MWPTLYLETPSLRAVSFCFIKWFSWIFPSTLFWWDLSVGVTDLPDLAVAHKLVSPTSCLNCCTQCLTVFTSTQLSPYTASMQRWMSMGGIFSPVENWITANCLNRTSSQPSILTGTEWELWIVVGSRLCMVEVRCHVTVWNWFYPFFFTPLKNMTGAKFSACLQYK